MIYSSVARTILVTTAIKQGTIVHHHTLKTCVIVIIPTFVPLQLEMDIYFSRVNDIIKKRKISKRVQFVLQDVVDLRDNQWVPRKRQDTEGKTIDQIHREAEDEEQMTKQLASQYIGGDGGDERKVGVRGKRMVLDTTIHNLLREAYKWRVKRSFLKIPILHLR